MAYNRAMLLLFRNARAVTLGARRFSLALVAASLLGGCHWLFPHRPPGADAGSGPAELGGDGRPSPLEVLQLAAGARHTCALFADGSVRCWGDGERGQLGDGARSRRETPGAVSLPGPLPEAIVAGTEHTCVLAAGSAYCWGDNTGRQSDPQSGDADVLTPRQVAGVDTIASLALGERSSCARRSDTGAITCWGGQSPPTEVPGLSGSYGLSCGAAHCCALVAAEVRCWGRSPNGEAGVVSDFVEKPLPVKNLGGEVSELACGEQHSCARTSGNTLLCWGSNGVDQVGASTQGPITVPVAVTQVGEVAAVVGGGNHTCVLGTAKQVTCFGYSRYGQLGIGTFGGDGRVTVVSPLASPRASSLAAGALHTCAIGEDGTQIWCWGSNVQGQAGVSPAASTASPVAAAKLGPVDELVAGGNHSCARRGGELWCWGFGGDGQLGDGAFASRGTPALVPAPAGASSAAPWQGIGRGGLHTCGIIDGQVWCWGAGWAGQLGQGKNSSSVTPVQTKNVAAAIAVAAGHDHSCALTKDSKVYCWGRNLRGQLGRPSSVEIELAGVVVAPAIRAIDARNATTCAIDENDKVGCWGDNRGGQLGSGVGVENRAAYGPVVGVPEARAIAVGGHHVCALAKATGKVHCWGNNSASQLGDGSTKSGSTPVEAVGLDDVSQLSAGWRHTCARRNVDGEVWCWGLNEARQAGASSGSVVHTPRLVLKGALEVRCGWDHTCVRLFDQSLRCFGSFQLGQLGDGQLAPTASPTRVL